MKVLAIDTSAKICSVAIVEDGVTLCELHNDSEREHSQTLMPMIKDLYDKTNLKLSDMDLFACGKGPGSFTGLRIGIATIDAFKDITDIPACGINSLEALAYGVIIKKGKENCKILSVINAKSDNYYYAVYRFHNGHLSLYKNPGMRNLTDTLNYVNLSEPLYIAGDSIPEKMEPILRVIKDKEQAEGKDIARHEYVTNLPTMAECIAAAAEDRFNVGTITDLSRVTPYYLRKPQAERQKDPDYFENSEVSILEMTEMDLDKIKVNYDLFENTWDIKTLEEDFRNSQYLVAKRNDQVLGFISYRVVLEELEIMNIVIRKDVRQHGIASLLLSHIIRMEDYDKINLEVNENNKSAIILYKKFGFRQVGVREKYYKGKEDAILMSI